MSKSRRSFSPEQKAAILREHLLDRVPVSEVCDKHGLMPTVFYRWQKELFERAPSLLEHKNRKSASEGLTRQIDALEPVIREAFLRSIADIRSEAQLSLVIDALERGDAQRLIAVLNLDPVLFAPLDRAIQGAYIEGGIRALSGLPVLPDPDTGGKSLAASMRVTRARSGG